MHISSFFVPVTTASAMHLFSCFMHNLMGKAGIHLGCLVQMVMGYLVCQNDGVSAQAHPTLGFCVLFVPSYFHQLIVQWMAIFVLHLLFSF